MRPFFLPLCGLCACGVCLGAITDEEVISITESVFPPSDGSTLSGQGAVGVGAMRTVLDRVNSTGCPAFVNSSSWPHDARLFSACMWSVLGRLANDQITGGGAFSAFTLDTHTGTILRGGADRDISRSTSIMSGLVVILLIALGMLMFMQSKQPKQAVN
jgi:hypothetical protein